MMPSIANYNITDFRVVHQFEFSARSRMDRIGAWSRAGKGLPVVAALVLVGAVSFTLVAAYQWAGRLGIFGEAATLAAGNWQGHI